MREPTFTDKSFGQIVDRHLSTILNYSSFRTEVTRCVSCSARYEARYPVPAQIVPGSRILFVGRNPGKIEDMQGIEFSPDARGGKLFQKYLEILGLGRKEVNITNTIFCHTKKDRPPQEEEISICSVWKYLEFKMLYKQVDRIFTLGQDATQLFLGQSVKVMDACGKVFKITIFGKDILVFPILHPGQISRRPDLGPENEMVLRRIKDKVDKNGWNRIEDN